MVRLLGKPGRRTLAVVRRLAGAKRAEVLYGPNPGLDNSITRIGNGRVLVACTDPISFIPGLGPRDSAWLSVHAIASDLSTSGLSPQYALFDLNLPPSLTDDQLIRYWSSIHEACKELGVAILGGHTGRFKGVDYTIVGGGSMMAIGRQDSYVTSSMASNNDELIATKSAAIEATAVLAYSFPHFIEKNLGRNALKTSRKLLRQTSTVEDALSAASVGVRRNGVTAMHDAAEGGVLSAVLELANASRLRASIDMESVPVSHETEKICELFGIDPLRSLGQGCLLIASKKSKTKLVIDALRRAGIAGNVIGRLSRGPGGSTLVRNGKESKLEYRLADPYWKAYWDGIKRGLN